MGAVSAQAIKYGNWCMEVGKHTSSQTDGRTLQCVFLLI